MPKITLPPKVIIRYQEKSGPQKGRWTQGEPEYVFDDLARAVNEAGYSWQRLMENEPWGPNPTMALLNTITKLNSE